MERKGNFRRQRPLAGGPGRRGPGQHVIESAKDAKGAF